MWIPGTNRVDSGCIVADFIPIESDRDLAIRFRLLSLPYSSSALSNCVQPYRKASGMTRTFFLCLLSLCALSLNYGQVEAQTSTRLTDARQPTAEASELGEPGPIPELSKVNPAVRTSSAGGVTILRHSSRPDPRVATDRPYRGSLPKAARAVRGAGGRAALSAASSVSSPPPGSVGTFTPVPGEAANQQDSPNASGNTTTVSYVNAAPGAPGNGPLTLPAAAPAVSSVPVESLDNGIPDAAAITSRMEQIKGQPGLDDESRTTQLKAYSDALEAMTTADQLSAKTVQLLQDIETVPVRAAEMKASLDKETVAEVPEIIHGTPLAEVDQILADYEAHLTEIQAERQKAVQAVSDQERRIRSIPALIDQAKQEITDDLAKLNGEGTAAGTILSEAATIRLRARGKMLECRLESLVAEQQSLKAGSELVSLKRELAEKREKVAEKTTKLWRAAVADYRQSEADRKAQEARQLLTSAHPALLEAAERNAELAEERTQLTRKLEKLTIRKTLVDEAIDSTNAAFDDVRTKYDAAGETTALGYLMRNYRSELPDAAELRKQQRDSEAEMSEVQMKLLLLKDERDTLPAFEEQLDRLHSDLKGEILIEQRQTFDETVATIRADRREYLQALITDYESQVVSLGNYNFAAGRLLESRDSFDAFIGEHVLWIRSAAPLTNRQEMAGATDAIAYLLSPANLISLVSQMTATAKARPFEAMVVLIIFAVALAYGRRFRKQLIESARLSSSQDSVVTALRAVGFSILAASVWPLLIALAASRINHLDNPTTWSTEFASALNSVAVLLLTGGIIRQLCREQGVGELIFGWKRRITSVIRKSIASAVVIGCPLAFGVNFLESHGDKVWIDSLGRTLFIGGMVLLSCIAHRVLHPREGILRSVDNRYPPTPTGKLPKAVYLFGLACPLALGVLAAAGYFFTAEHLAERLIQTLWLAIATAIGISLARRWLDVIAQELDKRLHNRRVEESHLTDGANNSEEPNAVASAISPSMSGDQEPSDPDSSSHHVTITPLSAETADDAESHSAVIRKQLGRLVNMTATVLLVLGCWSIWNSVLPALGILDRVEFGTTTVVAEKSVTGPDGTISVEEISEQKPITLRHLLISLGLIVVTCIAARNLPGLLEAVLFDRLPLDSGGRYAATTLSRYVLTSVGWVWALSTIGVTWGSIQWLVAAMTVGLGFGLQEIFGNLVSGLILLFERPVRVGDLVTVGGTTGTVTRMRIRATTITDPDRRELVVPNKRFITDEFVNWTLSDPITRVVFKVGVAYGTDTTQVHTLLMTIAENHPLVLDEPTHSALLTGFGDSTLDFELRVFIASRSSYVAVVHELNTAIEREFGKAEIEIAFPQRDLNIRSVEGLEKILPFRSTDEQRHAA